MNKRERKQYITELYDRSEELALSKRWYREQVKRYVLDVVASDASKDVTTRYLTDRTTEVSANIVLRESSMIAGVEEVQWVADKLGIETTKAAVDGKLYKAGSRLLQLFGSAKAVFGAERTLVNTLQRMSGIANHSNAMVRSMGSSVRVASTRKTLWGALDKRAAHYGKALTHRLGLHDAIMIKDNHVKLLRRFADIDLIKFPRKLTREVEVDTMEQLKEIFDLEMDIDIIMLDNFSPKQCEQAIALAKKMKQYQFYVFEASGSITFKNCAQYVGTGVDIISSGALTHSGAAVDISLEIANVYHK